MRTAGAAFLPALLLVLALCSGRSHAAVDCWYLSGDACATQELRLDRARAQKEKVSKETSREKSSPAL